MNRIKLTVFALVMMVFFLAAVQARPKYMRKFNADPKAKTQYKNKCTVCHIGKGGGENTYFGEAFSDAGEQFTPELRAKYPQYFNK